MATHRCQAPGADLGLGFQAEGAPVMDHLAVVDVDLVTMVVLMVGLAALVLAAAMVLEAVVPEVVVREAVVPEATVLEAVVPEAVVLEAVVLEAVVLEATVLEATVLEAAVLEDVALMGAGPGMEGLGLTATGLGVEGVVGLEVMGLAVMGLVVMGPEAMGLAGPAAVGLEAEDTGSVDVDLAAGKEGILGQAEMGTGLVVAMGLEVNSVCWAPMAQEVLEPSPSRAVPWTSAHLQEGIRTMVTKARASGLLTLECTTCADVAQVRLLAAGGEVALALALVATVDVEVALVEAASVLVALVALVVEVALVVQGVGEARAGEADLGALAALELALAEAQVLEAGSMLVASWQINSSSRVL